LETGDDAFIAHALGTLARAYGMSDIAAKVGMSRSGLYKALGPKGNPSFSMMRGLLASFGMRLSVHSQHAQKTLLRGIMKSKPAGRQARKAAKKRRRAIAKR
jgi:probable addiction module antidote protein